MLDPAVDTKGGGRRGTPPVFPQMPWGSTLGSFAHLVFALFC